MNQQGTDEPTVKVLLTPKELAERIQTLGREISGDFPDGVLIIGVLKGSLIFLADLARAISVDTEFDFLAISRYAPNSGRVQIIRDIDDDISGRGILLVEDIVDTGLTVDFLRRHLESRGARRIEVCTLLDRVSHRIVPVEVRYRAQELTNEYVLGFGLHHKDLYRNLPGIVTVDPGELQERADVYVDALYGPHSLLREDK